MKSTVASIRRNIFEPLQTLLNHSPKLRYWRKLEKTQYLSEAQLREIQWQRIKETLSFVWDHNEFYRDRFNNAGLALDEICSPQDLLRIPLLTKNDIRLNTTAMISKDYSIDNLQHSKTGGSTGKALELYYTEECSELRNACARRHDRWTGWEPGEPVAAIWGNPHYPDGFKERLKQWMFYPVIYLDTMKVNEMSVRNFVNEWHKVKPTLLMGHAHSIFLLSQYIRNLHITGLKPKGILSTSMMLMPHERMLIEDTFEMKVTDRYGCEEVSLIASECEKHEGMHLNIEHLFIEFIKDDGSPAGPGEPGKIVVSDLINRAMPLIRYQVEDVGVPTDRKCSCGRGLPLMESVTGRVSDFLIKKDGSRIAGVSLIENTLTKIPGIVQMQIIQENHDVMIVNLVTDILFKKDCESELKSYFKYLFELQTDVQLNFMESIPSERNGKYRFSICKITADDCSTTL